MIMMIEMMMTMVMIINSSRIAGYVTSPLRYLFTGDSTPLTILTMLTIVMIVLSLGHTFTGLGT